MFFLLLTSDSLQDYIELTLEDNSKYYLIKSSNDAPFNIYVSDSEPKAKNNG